MLSFDYNKLKEKHQNDGSHWSSYSDLFMVLSVVFLLLYVVASMRSTTTDAMNAIAQRKVISENNDLKGQIKAYNTLKNNYVENEADESEKKLYEGLMAKLDLLQDETDLERQKLEARAEENKKKVVALNKYQQLVRNIINTNLLAKKRLNHRNKVIVTKKKIITNQTDTIKKLDENLNEQTNEIQKKIAIIEDKEELINNQVLEIENQKEELGKNQELVSKLENKIQVKKQIFLENQEKIKELNSNLEENIKMLRKEENLSKSQRSKMQKQITLMRLKSRMKVKKLANENLEAEAKIQSLNTNMKETSAQLLAASEKIQKEEETKKKLLAEMEVANQAYKMKVDKLEGDFKQKIDSQRQDLEAKLAQEKGSVQEKIKRLAEFKAQTAKERKKLDAALGNLSNQVAEAKGKLTEVNKTVSDYAEKLEKAKNDHSRYLASIDKLKDEKKNLSGDLKRVQVIANAKKKLTKKITDRLKLKGIKANVDAKSGDVTLSFGDEYFDSGKATLKKEMESVLQKFFPVYAKSLLEDPNISKNVKSVEIVGFSSPTYKGKYVDPKSLNPGDRSALNYNLDLSFNRAKSIFSYMTDTRKMKFKFQKKILPLVKVTGRSFLVEGVAGRNVASGISTATYCKKFNCKKSQKVIIRFNLKD